MTSSTRPLKKSPGLTAVLALTLALGIGASTTIFSVVNSVVLRPLPYQQPDQLVRVYTEFHGKLGLSRFWLSVPELDDLLHAAESVLARTGDAVVLCPTYGNGTAPDAEGDARDGAA